MRKVLTVLFLLFAFHYAKPASFVVDSNTVMLIQGQGDLVNLQAGDTIYLLPGTYSHLRLVNFQGTAQNPVVIRNHPSGKVIISSNHYYGISISRSSYLSILGAGSPLHQYGIEIKEVNGNGLGASQGSYGITISNVHIHDVSGSGIQVKTDATCANWSRDSLTLYDIVIRHNKVERVGLEGLYLGSTKYFGHNAICGTDTLTLFDPLLQHVRVHNNFISRTGWDALQVAGAFDVEIYGNTIEYDSRENVTNQMSGIAIGSGCIPYIHGNSISYGNGNGISSFGFAGQRIYNNIIYEAGRNDTGSAGGHGIYLTDKEDTNRMGQTFVVNNTIVHPNKGIKIQNAFVDSDRVTVANNWIIDPKSYDFYDSINQTTRAFFQTPGNGVISFNNVFNSAYSSGMFENLNGTLFSPAFGSEAVDAGNQVPFFFFTTDFLGNSRAQGFRSDVGAVESPYFSSGINDAEKNQSYIYDNPLRDREWFWKFRGFSSGEVTITVFDSRGLQVFRTTKFITSPETQFNLTIPSKMAPGVYVVHVETPDFRHGGVVIVP